jgi:hypothetical protein
VDWTSVLEIAVGVLAGGAINAYFARRGSQELRREAEGLKQEAARLQRHTTLILRGLEEAGLVEYNRNEQGEIVGMVIKARAIVRGSSSASATATVQKHPAQRPSWRRLLGA